MPKAWRRSASAFGGAGQLPTPPAVHVVTVRQGGDPDSAVWTFDAPIANAAVAAGLLIDGQPPITLLGATGSSIELGGYAHNTDPGNPWEVIAVLCVGLTFTGGGILVDGAGSVV